ncbi:MAG: STAS domain-containing protein [Anaerolineales bacterium]|nr:MAG: anti-sigma factor antagonist [Chloroflexota bacterium]MBE7432358.1 STAS domain-containing protein [Anaerolineales bacterium]MCE7859698.1 anti-sigma factor antagonist [Chloroflexi bacterium CFX2]MCK6584566.1 STAS domain-containing protein [Anaerolineales bacterium]
MPKIDFKLKSEQIQREGKDPVTVITVQGWLDGQSDEKFVSAAQEAHSQGSRLLIVNLEDVSTLTSAGIRALQRTYLLFNPSEHTVHNGRMRLCNAPPQVYHVLSLTGFLQSCPNYETLQAALNSLPA